MNPCDRSRPLCIRDLTFRYRIREEPAILDLSLDLHAGELLLVAGTSGCGKTTLIRCVNGVIPRSYRGELSGQVQIFGQPARKMSMAKLSQTVGTLLQDPERQIVGSYVLNELAFGLENLGMPLSYVMASVSENFGFHPGPMLGLKGRRASTCSL